MINKNQLDEIILNSLYLMGGSNKTPFNDIIFFDEEKDIDKGIYSKVLNTLYNSDDEYLFSDLLDDFDENDDYESRIRELGIKLREAVEIENYEEAARLRDMIHQLKKMDNTDDSTQGGGHDA